MNNNFFIEFEEMWNLNPLSKIFELNINYNYHPNEAYINEVYLRCRCKICNVYYQISTYAYTNLDFYMHGISKKLSGHLYYEHKLTIETDENNPSIFNYRYESMPTKPIPMPNFNKKNNKLADEIYKILEI